MAIAGGAAPTFEAQIKDGKLVMENQALRQGAIADIDFALQELFKGKVVFLSARADVTSAVQRTVDMALGKGRE